MTRRTRRSARTGRGAGAALLLLASALCLWAATEHRALPQVERAAAQARDISVAASATYVTLRTLNAFLSSAQEVEVGVAFFGQASAQPMKVLEPIDDTVERIAGVVFVVMVTAGVLAVSMGSLGAVGFALLALAALLGAAVVASGRALGGVPNLLAVYGGFLGLGIPLAFLVSTLAADALTERVWSDHSRVVAEITATVEGETLEDAEGGLRATLGRVDQYRQIAGNIFRRADDLIGSLISLLAVFIFKIFVLPVVLAGGLLVVIRRLGRMPVREP